MLQPDAAKRTLTASGLYDLATCEHRVALDFVRPRAERTPPDEAARLLLERGREFEAGLAARMGWAAVEPHPDDPEAAFQDTLALMRAGAPVIYQGLLRAGRYLAIPDLLRKAEGASNLGDYHYVAGDIKSGRTPRTDQVFQVVFAANILEAIQGRRPGAGFLLLGDETESSFAIDDVWDAAMLALERLEAIADGKRETFPFYSAHCARCRWRGTCLPELELGPDASLVAGMTPTRKRMLLAHGIGTLPAVASLDKEALAALAAKGVGTDGLRQLQKQAQALVTRQVIDAGRSAPNAGPPGPGIRASGGPAASSRITPLRAAASDRRYPVAADPGERSLDARGREGERTAAAGGGSDGRENFLVAEWDPLGGGGPFLLGWATRAGRGKPFDRQEIRLDLASAGPAGVREALLAWGGSGGEPIVHYGGAVPRVLDWLVSRGPGGAGALASLEQRLVNLAPLIRRGSYLPVRRYEFHEVVAALHGQRLPPLGEPEDAPFVWAENLRLGAEGAWEGRLRDRTMSDLEGLAFLIEWLPTPTMHRR